jgi:hypothetical protein
MCDQYKSCAFYCTYNTPPNNSKRHQLLIDAYCEGDLHEVCRRKGYEEEMRSTPLADLGPNGYSVDSHQRIY